MSHNETHVMKYADKYPKAWSLQQVEGMVCRAITPNPCLRCGDSTDFITYAFPRPAVPVCSSACHVVLEEIQKDRP